MRQSNSYELTSDGISYLESGPVQYLGSPLYSLGNQDAEPNKVAVSGSTLTLYGNTWKGIEYPYEIGDDTWFKVEYRSMGELPEIAGVQFLPTTTGAQSAGWRFWQFEGSQTWGKQFFNNYLGSGWKTYLIHVGDKISGPINYLGFVSDNDAGNAVNVNFRNPELFEITLNDLIEPEWGHTGNWFNPEATGQGFNVEVNTVNDAIVVEWATYTENDPGGDGRYQRWYSQSGVISPGAKRIRLDTYAVNGGAFNNPHPVNEQLVGEAFLSFLDCETGILEYEFTTGELSGRTGTILIDRLTPNIDCSENPYTGPGHDDFGFSGNWWNPSTSGQGLFFEVNPELGAFIGHWYTFKKNGQGQGPGAQRWFVMSGTYTPGSPSGAAMTIYQPMGGVFDNPGEVNEATVGTASVTFTSCTSGYIDYSFTGGSLSGEAGQIPIQRLTPNVACP